MKAQSTFQCICTVTFCFLSVTWSSDATGSSEIKGSSGVTGTSPAGLKQRIKDVTNLAEVDHDKDKSWPHDVTESGTDPDVEDMRLDKRRFDSIGGSSSFGGFGKRTLDYVSGMSGLNNRNIEDSKYIDEDDSADDDNDEDGYAYVKYDGEDKRFVKRPFDRISSSAFHGFGKRPFDRISGSAFHGFGKRPFDRISGSAFHGFGKRPFDRISGSAFHGFGKRPFDRISGSAFHGFGKRPFDRISGSAFHGFGKRPVDRISGSAFHGFGKRPFDRISGSAFHGFGKRPFDRIASSSFHSFGKRTLHDPEQEEDEETKRSFDRIGGSRFSAFGKRQDELLEEAPSDTEDNISFDSTDNDKRRFDSISSASNFGGFGKRSLGDEEENELQNQREARTVHIRKRRSPEGAFAVTLEGDVTSDTPTVLTTPTKRRFDTIDARSSFRRWGRSLDGVQSNSHGKRRFDRIGGSGFSGFGKRSFDRIGGSGFSGFGKRSFDRIGGSGFTGFGKRAFDRIGASRFSSFGVKRSFDRIGGSGFSGFGKRSFDRIGGSGFSGFGKRAFDRITGSGFSRFDRNISPTVLEQFNSGRPDTYDAVTSNDLPELIDQKQSFLSLPSPDQVLASAILEELLLHMEKNENRRREEEQRIAGEEGEAHSNPAKSHKLQDTQESTAEQASREAQEAQEVLLDDLLLLAGRVRQRQA